MRYRDDEPESHSCGHGEARKETNTALLVRHDDGEEVWYPKSQIHDDSEVYEEGHEGEVVITYWLAKERGLV